MVNPEEGKNRKCMFDFTFREDKINSINFDMFGFFEVKLTLP